MYPKKDIATYFDVWNVAVELSSQCVEENSVPQAGWSVTGKSVHISLSIELFHLRFKFDFRAHLDHTDFRSMR